MFKDCDVICWGIGKNFYSYMKRLDQKLVIKAFCDNDTNKWGKVPLMDGRKCLSPEELITLNKPIVIITLEQMNHIIQVETQLDDMQIEHYRVKELLNILEYEPDSSWLQENAKKHVHKFIDLNLHGTTTCNFHCDYCYVWRRFGFEERTILSEHTPKEIRNGLTKEKLGGLCYINICARGETLLTDKIVELIYELLEEGHYISVVTNGTVTSNIKKIISFPEEMQSRMFFKLSFHYIELKKRNLFEHFWNNVELIKKSKCSYTLEITPFDGLVDSIDEVKEMFMNRANGVMPHISFARDSTKVGYDILSEYSVEEYKQIWSTFDSEMFTLKSNYYDRKIEEFCYAGRWSYLVNVLTGDIKACYGQPVIGNIYDKEMKEFPVCEVGQCCKMEYCFNNHAFLAWGNVPQIKCSNYLQMRDREDKDGNHWVKEPFYSFINEKLSETNFQYAERWDDYNKLKEKGRKAAVILFNSPDYANIGDHAIALAEKRFFKQYFSEYEFIEVACNEYQLENLDVLRNIQEKDIIIISGGGNLGTLYLRIEDYILNIITCLKKNKIFIFPQSIYFEQCEFGRKELECLNSVLSEHGNVYLVTRDEQSFKLAKDSLSTAAEILYMPDIALFLKANVERKIENEILLCMRNDNESIGWNKANIMNLLQNMHCKIENVNTLYEKEVTLNEREKEVRSVMERLAKKKLVITDRLHGMILCALVGTPCIALDNVSCKVSGAYKWLKDVSYIQCICSEEELPLAIETVMKSEISFEQAEQLLSHKFSELAQEIRKGMR